MGADAAKTAGTGRQHVSNRPSTIGKRSNAMQAIREGRRITGQVILTIPFFGQSCRKADFPKPAGLLLVKPHIFGPKQKIVKRPAKTDQDGTTVGLTESGIEMLFIQTAP